MTSQHKHDNNKYINNTLEAIQRRKVKNVKTGRYVNDYNNCYDS